MKSKRMVNLDLLEYHYGDLIETIIVENRYQIDLDEDYDYLLRYIYRNLVKSWFKGRDPSPEEFEAKLKSVREKYRGKLVILMSYLVSRYALLKNEEVLGRIRRDDKF